MEQTNQPNRVKEFFTSTLGRVTVTIVSAIIIYGIMLISLESDSTVVLSITALTCVIFGWRALNKITPNIFLIGTMKFWLFYYLIKGVLSVFVGVFVAPFQIAKMISDKLSQSMSQQ